MPSTTATSRRAASNYLRETFWGAAGRFNAMSCSAPAAPTVAVAGVDAPATARSSSARRCGRSTTGLQVCCHGGKSATTEGDFIIGLNRSAISTVVERSSRYTLLVHLPRLAGYGTLTPAKNGPALGG